MRVCLSCRRTIHGDEECRKLYYSAFDNICSYICSYRCWDQAVSSYNYCLGCRRFVQNSHPKLVGRQWRKVSVGKETVWRCLRCYELHVLERGQQRCNAWDSAFDVHWTDADEAIARWSAAGYVLVETYHPKSASAISPIIRSLVEDVRWDKCFVAQTQFQYPEIRMDLYMHPRCFRRQAVDAAVTFLLCVKHMVVRGGYAGLLDVARNLIARPLANSGLDPLWADVYVQHGCSK